MFGKRIDRFRLMGIPIRLDLSWFFIAILITWSLASGVFPATQPGLSTATYWVMGVAGALGLFASIVVHEFFHAVVARRKGMPIRGITLFVFGGVAEMADEPPSAKAEFLMAGAGPLASLVISGVIAAITFVVHDIWPPPAVTVASYLGTINLLLAAFNLVPAFPLDGGRMLRAALWHWKHDLRAATRIASRIGAGFGMLLIALGVFRVLGGDFIGGMWWALIGLFLRGLATASYQGVALRHALEGEPVRRFMKPDPVAVPPGASLAELVDDYIYRYHHKLFPVVEDGRLSACITTRQVQAVPRTEWEVRTVGDAAVPCVPDLTTGPEADAVEALAKMRRSGATRLLVVDGDRLIGTLTMKDLLEFFALKMELESDQLGARPTARRRRPGPDAQRINRDLANSTTGRSGGFA